MPFDDGAFDLALVSHLLFSYSEHLGADGHRNGLIEMMRVAHEVRIYPLVTLSGESSPYVEPAIAKAEGAGWQAEVIPVDYAFQRGADRMLRLWHVG